MNANLSEILRVLEESDKIGRRVLRLQALRQLNDERIAQGDHSDIVCHRNSRLQEQISELDKRLEQLRGQLGQP